MATAKQGVQDERIDMRVWVRGYPQPGANVFIGVFRRAGVNAVDVAKSVRDLLPSIQSQLPGSVLLFTAYDRSQTIVTGINDVKTTLYLAFVLVVMVIFIFLGRATDTLIPAVALAAVVAADVRRMNILGYSLDNLSLMALTLAIGFLVDDAIVFLENTVRLMEQEGMNAFDASIESAKEISFTILAMTLSLAAVFIPLVFMSGLMGRIFREFSITIVISILASGIVSLTLTPLMTSRLLSNRGKGAKKTWMERVFGAIERRVLDIYGRQLWFFLRQRWISAVIWVVCLVGTGYLFYVVPKAFLPVGDSSFIRGILVAQEGTSPDQMHAYQTASGEDHEGESRRPQHLHDERQCCVPRLEPGLPHRLPQASVAACADRASRRTAHGWNRLHHSRHGCVPPAEPSARNLHWRDRQRAGPVCLRAFWHRCEAGV